MSPPQGLGMPVIEVRQLENRPRLALISREGDPAPALVVSYAAGVGAIGHTALAALLETRLREAGFAAQGESDGLGVRLRLSPITEEQLATVVSTLQQVSQRPVTANESLVEVARRLSVLRRRPLDHAALEPVTACSAELAVTAKTPMPDVRSASGRAQLEAWRSQALVQQRTAMALVGPRSAGRILLEALQNTAGWPSGAGPAETWPSDPVHAAYLSAELPEGQSRVDVAVRVPSATAAVVSVRRMAERRSALALKLGALEHPWRLEAIHATAHARGGCIRLRLRPRRALPLVSLPKEAGALIPLIEREVKLQAALPVVPFDVTREIIAAGDASDAAARASWWALTSDVDEPMRSFSALAFSAHGRDAPEESEGSLDGDYRTAVDQAPRLDADQLAERVVRVEQGQGELWVLVGSPCALAQEGGWDAGRAALAALTVAADAALETSVEVEPWISSDGVGIAAHGGLRGTDDTPTELARRVARVAVRSFASIPSGRQAFARAKRSLLASLSEQSSHAALAQTLVPAHPSWLDPWGRANRQASTTLSEVADRWRDLLHEPVRVAVLANGDEAQADVAFAEVDRHLLADARARACAVQTRPPPEPTMEAATPPKASRWLLGVTLPLADGIDENAELTAALLERETGALAKANGRAPTVHVLGGARARALVVEVDAGDEELNKRLLASVGQLAEPALAPDALRQLEQRARARWLERQREPLQRVSALFRGASLAPPKLDTSAWATWLSETFRDRHWVLVGAR